MEATIFILDFLNIRTPQFISQPAHRFNLYIRADKGKLFSRKRQVYLNIVVLRLAVKAPYFNRQLFAAQYVTLVCNQIFDYAVLFFPQPHGLSALGAVQGRAGSVQNNIPKGQRAVGAVYQPPAQRAVWPAALWS